MDGTPRLLRVDEAASLLRQSRSTLYRKLAAGELRAVRLGDSPRRPLRIPAVEVERYLGGTTWVSEVARPAAAVTVEAAELPERDGRGGGLVDPAPALPQPSKEAA